MGRNTNRTRPQNSAEETKSPCLASLMGTSHDVRTVLEAGCAGSYIARTRRLRTQCRVGVYHSVGALPDLFPHDHLFDYGDPVSRDT